MPHVIQRESISETMAITLNTGHGQITLATSYLPPSCPYLQVHDFDRLAAIPHPNYIMGDLNAHYCIFGYANPPNTIGNQLSDLIDDEQWTHLGPPFKTFDSYRSAGPPVSDHTAVKAISLVNPLVVQTAPCFVQRR